MSEEAKVQVEAIVSERAARRRASSSRRGDDPPREERSEEVTGDPQPTDRVQPSLGLTEIQLDDEIVLVDPLTDAYLRLNASATRIWRELTLVRPRGRWRAL